MIMSYAVFFFHIYKYKLGFLFNILQNLCPKVLESCRIDVLYCMIPISTAQHRQVPFIVVLISIFYRLLINVMGKKGVFGQSVLVFLFFFKDSPCCFGGLTEFHC